MRLLYACMLGALLLAPACADDSPRRPRNALLVTLDTTRADALGCYGGPPGVTPHLDRLASESVRFERAHTVAPITLPAHASMLTGLVPPRHGLRDNGLAPLPTSARTLAEAAREHGHQTAAFVAASALDRAFGLDQGFEVYAQPTAPPGGAGAAYLELQAPDVVRAALSWLQRRDRARPFFLWVHLFDPHAPYAPPPAALGRARGNAYLGEVALADDAIGTLLESLRAEGALDETLVVVLADHGESLGEHGEPTHGGLCYEPTMRIPFLVRWPDGRRAGEVSRAPVSAADVFPTLVEALELGPVGDVDGVSLWAADPPAERGLYLESYAGWLNHGWSPLAGWVAGGLKYLHSSEPELYDLDADPREARNLLTERGPAVAAARAAIGAVHEGRPLAVDSSAAIPESLLRDLRQLGYGATGGVLDEIPHPLEPSDRPSPRARAVELVPLERANEHIVAGHFDQAADVLRGMLAENPRNAMALDLLAFALMQIEQFAEAADALERRLPLGVPRCDSLTSLGVCNERLGRPERAEQAYRRAVGVDDSFAPALAGLARVLQAQGRADEARPWIERLEALPRR